MFKNANFICLMIILTCTSIIILGCSFIKKDNGKNITYNMEKISFNDYKIIDPINYNNKIYFIINKNNNYGIVDIDLKEVIKPKYQKIDIYDKKYLIIEENNLFKVIDIDNKIITKTNYNNIEYNNNLGLFVATKNNNTVLINNSGKVVFDFKEEVYTINENNISNTIGIFKNKKNKKIYINNKFKKISLDNNYETLFENGIIKKIDNKLYLIDFNNNKILDKDFTSIKYIYDESINKYTYMILCTSEYNCELYKQKVKKVLSGSYSKIHSIYSNYIAINIGENSNIIDFKGNLIYKIPFYDNIQFEVKNNLLHIITKNNEGLIDKKGKTIIEFKYSNINIINNIIIATNKNKIDLYNINGVKQKLNNTISINDNLDFNYLNNKCVFSIDKKDNAIIKICENK